MLAHFIEINVFSTPEDDEAKVYQGFLSFLPVDLKKEKISLKRTTAEGFNDRKIIIFQVSLSRQRHINAFLKSLSSRLSQEQKEFISQQKDKRVDDSLYFFLRFDKEKLLEEGRLWLTDCGNCYHIKIALAPFPRKKELALKIVDDLLKPENIQD